MADSRRPAGLRSAIIDIGSNSVRLVVYGGSARAPMPIFNEKLMVGLGSNLATTGRIDPAAYQRGIAALARFRELTAAMELDSLRCVATAAVRDAANGAAFLNDARAVGLEIDLLSGDQEAEAAGYGVIHALPHADGIVADLGGGSLELVRIGGGMVHSGQSFPLGVLRLAALRAKHGRRFIQRMIAQINGAGWPGDCAGKPLYLVGGSWRALARYDMLVARDALPVVSGHRMPIAAADRLARRLGTADLSTLALQPGMTTARVASMPDAAVLLIALVRALKASELIVSASGLREGLLYQALSPEQRAKDPLLVAAAAEGRRFARFAPHGPEIDRWIAPLFADDSAADARLRLAACLMSDVGSSANPDFRAERAAEMALHGNWLGIDPDERQIIAQTLYTAMGGAGRLDKRLGTKGQASRLRRAMWWGQAIRLAQRLSAGTAAPLSVTRLALEDAQVVLTIDSAHRALVGEQVDKRLRQLAQSLGSKYRIDLRG